MTSLTSLSANPPPSFAIADATPAAVRQEAKEIKEKFTDAINHIIIIKQRSSPNTNTGDAFTALSLALGEASEASAHVTLPSMVHADADVRAASHAAKDDFKNMFDAALSDDELYNSLLEHDINNGNGNSDNGEGGEDARFQRNILRTLRRNGCGLGSKSDKDAVQTKRREIEDACTSFCAAINENDECLLFTDEELDGVDDLDRYPIDDEKSGKRRIGLKAPDTLPLLKFARTPTTRRKVSEALSRKCQEENTPRFLEVLKLRDSCAKLLGYESHASLMCEVKMVGTPQKAEKFLLELVDAYEPIRKRELELLLDMKKKDIVGNTGEGTVSLDPWDIAYYTGKYKAECAGVDEAIIQQYFPLEHVKSTILTIYEELLGLKFERVLDAEVWNEDVECYAVRSVSPDGRGDVLGYFYLDLFPRKGKYSHQCVYPLRPSYNKAGEERVLPACVNVGNLTPSREGVPSVLLFREVETFFHEFGHVCHCVLTNSRHSLHSWAWSAVPWPGGVEQDFLEVPSMMLENFVWCPEIIRRLSKPCLPESTIDALSKSRFLMTGYAKSKYLAMSLYDLKVHSGSGPYEFEGREYDAVSLYNTMIERYTGIPTIHGSFAAASWFHLLMGYDAGYYGYIYSETFAADLFSKFSELSNNNKPVIDLDLGMKYRDKILSPCATVDGGAMLVNFLGRDPSNDAFLRRIPMS